MQSLPLPVEVMLSVVTLLLAVTVHEFSHAFAAYKLGDDTAARQGRLTLNPFSHADPVGTFILPIVGTLAGGWSFGWGNPVPYVPTRLTRKVSMRAGEAIVAFAGPFSNFLMAFLAGFLWVLLHHRLGIIGQDSPFYVLLLRLLQLNASLFFFNLIPVPPLDGSKVVSWLLGQKADKPLDAIQSAGPFALMIVLIAGGSIISPLVGALIRLILDLFSGLA